MSSPTSPLSPSSRFSRRTLFAGSAALALSAAACSSDDSGTTADGKAVVSFWDDNAGPVRTPLYEELIKRFEAKNPTIKIDYVGLPEGQAQQKYDSSVINGSAPDIGSLTTSTLAGLLAQQAILPLDERLAASSLKDKLQPAMLDGARKTASDRKLYMLPTNGNFDLMWYRKDMFEAAGVEIPETWDEFFAAAAKLTDAGASKYGFTIRGGTGSIFQVIGQAFSYSGAPSFFDESGTCLLNDPKAAEMVSKIAGLFKVSTPSADVNNNFTQMVAQFTGGNIAMMHHNLGSASTVEKELGDKAGVFALPIGPGGTRTYVTNPVAGLSLFKQSKNPDAAWTFMEFMQSHEANSFLNAGIGQTPANIDAGKDEWAQKNQGVKLAADILGDSKAVPVAPPVYLPEYSSITKADSEPEYQKVLLGTLKADEFLATMAGKFTEAQKAYKARNPS